MYLNRLLDRLDGVVVLGGLRGAGDFTLGMRTLWKCEVGSRLLVSVPCVTVSVEESLSQVISPTRDAGRAVGLADPGI